MNDSTKSTWKAFLRGVAWLLFGIAGLAFWVGDKAIRVFTKADLVLSETGGIFLAVLCGALGALAKSAGEEDVNEDEG